MNVSLFNFYSVQMENKWTKKLNMFNISTGWNVFWHIVYVNIAVCLFYNDFLSLFLSYFALKATNQIWKYIKMWFDLIIT